MSRYLPYRPDQGYLVPPRVCAGGDFEPACGAAHPEDLAFRYLAGGAGPDYWALNAFRRRRRATPSASAKGGTASRPRRCTPLRNGEGRAARPRDERKNTDDRHPIPPPRELNLGHKANDVRCHDPRLRRMREKMRSEQGRHLYRKRRSIVEPVFGVLKRTDSLAPGVCLLVSLIPS
jgi:hypothetical protein